MSRCYACDKILNDYEMTRKSAVTGQYLDLCNACYSTIRGQIHTKERPDLLTESDSYEMEHEIDEKDLTDWK